MNLIIIYASAVLVLIYITIIKGSDRSVIRKSTSAALFWIALTLLSINGAIWLVFGITSMVSGGLNGLINLIPALLINLLIYLCWKRPFEGGITVVVSTMLVFLLEISVILTSGKSSENGVLAVAIGILPSFFAGLLLVIAHLQGRRPKGGQDGNESPQ